ncbi:M20 metallopeptidase family protein [Vaginisenegalia massiliensis]|uniref:M20 metallopeptidase family protein n=1 Tax=Vaginisenegalia massiliensis TaxID=2058294 RepID=UPI000F51EF12|nr:amidohydrolase [Vaginisenegalia massiliensis]
MDIKLASQAVLTDMIQWRRDLHQIPELGNELPQTVAYVCHVLEELGIDYDSSYVEGNGIVALIDGQGPKSETSQRVLAMRADMDGLPIQEATGLVFSSLNQNMHACGHDGHTAILLGAAKILQANRHLFSGTIKLIFQPGEEYPGGARPMIEEGALDNPRVTRIVGIHEGQLDPNAPSGTIAYKAGALMASMDRFLIEIVGKGWHGAYPEQAHDPIVAAGQLITALQTIKSRNIKASQAHVISITRVEGGYNQNIIPDCVELEGTVRTFDDELRRFIHQKIDQIAQGISQAMGVTCRVTYDYKYPAVLNDAQVVEESVAALSRQFGPDRLFACQEALMGGEDFAFYLKEVPGAYFFLTNPGMIEGAFHGHHHPKFDVDESYFALGAATFVSLALDYLA